MSIDYQNFTATLLRLNNVVTSKTAFRDFQSLLNAAGAYRPSIDVRDPDLLFLADAYDAAQEARGDSRRAFRYGTAAVKRARIAAERQQHQPERRKVPRGTVVPTGRWVVYDEATTIIPRKPSRRAYWQDAIYATKGAAAVAQRKLQARDDAQHKSGVVVGEPKRFAIAEEGYFKARIEAWESKRNLLNKAGGEFRQSVNTPACCDPSTETYHSM